MLWRWNTVKLVRLDRLWDHRQAVRNRLRWKECQLETDITWCHLESPEVMVQLRTVGQSSSWWQTWGRGFNFEIHPELCNSCTAEVQRGTEESPCEDRSVQDRIRIRISVDQVSGGPGYLLSHCSFTSRRRQLRPLSKLSGGLSSNSSLLKSHNVELTANVTSHHVGYGGFQDLLQVKEVRGGAKQHKVRHE